MAIRDLGTLSAFTEGGNIYRAYEGPETGGFNVLPQSAVPDLGPGLEDEVRRNMLGAAPLAGADPLAAELAPRPARPGAIRDLGPLTAFQARATPPSAPPAQPDLAPPAAPPEVSAAVAAQTLAPKGGVPRQLTATEAKAWSLYDRLHSAGDLERKVKAKGAWQNFKEMGYKRYGDAVLAIPSLAGDIASSFFRDPKELIEKGVFGYTPRLHVEDVGAGLLGVQAATQGKDPVEAFRGGKETFAETEAALETEYPWSTVFGRAGGDIATIAGPRALTGPKVIEDIIKSTARREAKAASLAATPGRARYFANAANSGYAKWVRNTGKKGAEVGLEASALAALHGGDPVETAAYAGAGQLTGSGILLAAHHPLKASLLGSVIVWQMFDNLTPAQGDSLDWTAQKVLDKAAGVGVLGLASTLAGAGRFRGAPNFKHWKPGNIAEDFPPLAEGVNAAIRTNASSLWEQYITDKRTGGSTITPVMSKLATDMAAFKPEEIRRLERAAMNNKLYPTIMELSRNKDFRTRMGMQ